MKGFYFLTSYRGTTRKGRQYNIYAVNRAGHSDNLPHLFQTWATAFAWANAKLVGIHPCATKSEAEKIAEKLDELKIFWEDEK